MVRTLRRLPHEGLLHDVFAPEPETLQAERLVGGRDRDAGRAVLRSWVDAEVDGWAVRGDSAGYAVGVGDFYVGVVGEGVVSAETCGRGADLTGFQVVVLLALYWLAFCGDRD